MDIIRTARSRCGAASERAVVFHMGPVENTVEIVDKQVRGKITPRLMSTPRRRRIQFTFRS